MQRVVSQAGSFRWRQHRGGLRLSVVDLHLLGQGLRGLALAGPARRGCSPLGFAGRLTHFITLEPVPNIGAKLGAGGFGKRQLELRRTFFRRTGHVLISWHNCLTSAGAWHGQPPRRAHTKNHAEGSRPVPARCLGSPFADSRAPVLDWSICRGRRPCSEEPTQTRPAGQPPRVSQAWRRGGRHSVGLPRRERTFGEYGAEPPRQASERIR